MTLNEWRKMSEPERMEARLNVAAHVLAASGETPLRVSVTSEVMRGEPEDEVAEGWTAFRPRKKD